MRNKQRLPIILLTLLLLFGSVAGLISCGEDPPKEEATTTEKQTDKYLDDLPENLSFPNTELRFLVAEPSLNKGGTFSERSIGIVGYTIGDTNAVDDQVYYRNLAIEERLGVYITPTVIDDGIIKNVLYSELLSGTSEFDVICAYQAWDVALATSGIILNYNNLDSYQANYVDISKPYWSKTYSEALAYKNDMYWITGDLSLRYLGGMYCTFVNLDIYEDALKSSYGDIYKIVDDKQWNLETMGTMIKDVFHDTGTAPEVSDEGDLLGFTIELIDPLDGMTIGAGINFSYKDADGNVFIALADNSRNASAFSFIDKMYEILYQSKGAFVAKSNHSANSMGLFAQGNVLFTHDKVYQAEVYLSEMENYGILPSPMLNEAQGQYRAGIHDGCTLFGIYSKSKNIPASAATLEAMAALSYETVTPYYYDEALKLRYSRDPQSSKMIDLIRDSVYIDFAFGWGNSISSIHNFFRAAVKEQTTSSTFRKTKNIWDAERDKLVAALEEAGAAPVETK